MSADNAIIRNMMIQMAQFDYGDNCTLLFEQLRNSNSHGLALCVCAVEDFCGLEPSERSNALNSLAVRLRDEEHGIFAQLNQAITRLWPICRDQELMKRPQV